VMYARLGKHREAIADLRKAVAPPSSPQVLYQAACIQALLPEGKRKTKHALSFLSQSLQAGYGADSLKVDSDLDSLRDSAGFNSLLKVVDLGNHFKLNHRPKDSLPHQSPPHAP
ncbi:MAG: hypothetical protein MI861_12200, partial [Pirellulales bacterium]|nr:hypothetical protein [Pirellulales bacterium]